MRGPCAAGGTGGGGRARACPASGPRLGPQPPAHRVRGRLAPQVPARCRRTDAPAPESVCAGQPAWRPSSPSATCSPAPPAGTQAGGHTPPPPAPRPCPARPAARSHPQVPFGPLLVLPAHGRDLRHTQPAAPGLTQPGHHFRPCLRKRSQNNFPALPFRRPPRSSCRPTSAPASRRGPDYLPLTSQLEPRPRVTSPRPTGSRAWAHSAGSPLPQRREATLVPAEGRLAVFSPHPQGWP